MSTNFNPQEILAAVSDCVQRVEAVEAKIEQVLQVVGPLVTIFAPFLPTSVATYATEIPALVAEVQKVKTFVNDVLPELASLVGAAGVGATQELAAKATPIPATAVGTFTAEPNAPEIPSSPPPAGMKYEIVDGKVTLMPVTTEGT